MITTKKVERGETNTQSLAVVLSPGPAPYQPRALGDVPLPLCIRRIRKNIHTSTGSCGD